MEGRPQKANDYQVGGSHYKGAVTEPWDFIHQHGLGFLDGTAIKYLARWRKKDGVKDLHKALHYIQKLIEQESVDGHEPDLIHVVV